MTLLTTLLLTSHMIINQSIHKHTCYILLTGFILKTITFTPKTF